MNAFTAPPGAIAIIKEIHLNKHCLTANERPYIHQGLVEVPLSREELKMWCAMILKIELQYYQHDQVGATAISQFRTALVNASFPKQEMDPSPDGDDKSEQEDLRRQEERHEEMMGRLQAIMEGQKEMMDRQKEMSLKNMVVLDQDRIREMNKSLDNCLEFAYPVKTTDGRYAPAGMHPFPGGRWALSTR